MRNDTVEKNADTNFGFGLKYDYEFELAVSVGNLELMKVMCTEGCIFGNSLMTAVRFNHFDAVKWFIENGVNVKKGSSWKCQNWLPGIFQIMK